MSFLRALVEESPSIYLVEIHRKALSFHTQNLYVPNLASS